LHNPSFCKKEVKRHLVDSLYSRRLKLALRNAANAIGQLKEGHLNAFLENQLQKKEKPQP
jgi:hypothetical protein